MKQAPKMENWKDVYLHREYFQGLVTFLRSERVKSFEIDGIRLEFQEAKYITAGEPKNDPPPVVSDEQLKKEEETNLYWSAGG